MSNNISNRQTSSLDSCKDCQQAFSQGKSYSPNNNSFLPTQIIKTSNQSQPSKLSISSKNSSVQTRTEQRPNDVEISPLDDFRVSDEDRIRARYISTFLDRHGLCPFKDFLPNDHAEAIYKEVSEVYKNNTFRSGEVISRGNKSKVRGDMILWVGKDYNECKSVKLLCDQLDKLILLCTEEQKSIKSRTRGMVACYPGSGTHYKKHVDNPIKDGRIITALYYLNKDWNVERDGGLLRVYPSNSPGKNVDCAPVFNTLFLFFSDSRNPHEVLPTYRDRFAITHWYFDFDEREAAYARYAKKVSK